MASLMVVQEGLVGVTTRRFSHVNQVIRVDLNDVPDVPVDGVIDSVSAYRFGGRSPAEVERAWLGFPLELGEARKVDRIRAALFSF
jgi:hypothetical protein